MNKALIKRVLRRLGIIRLSDNFRYQLIKIYNKKDNTKFKNEHPNVVIPPDYILYESHYLNYRGYFTDGLTNAENLKKHFEKYIDLANKKALDWGCGPARIVRHFPSLLPSTMFYGTDYNQKTIVWNAKNIKNITFCTNKTNPPTNFEDDFFDAIYGLSVLTHLSEDNHFNWISELYRIAAKNAILLLTTHGEVYKTLLLPKDSEKFDANKLVVQANTLEGHRTFATYHPPKLMREMLSDKFQVLEHIVGKKEVWGLSQDIWILKKL